MLFEGIYRRFQTLRVAKGPLDARLTFTESLAVEQVGPPGHEMTRAGRRFGIAYNGTAPTGQAPVQALPTTLAGWVIWNGDAAKSYSLEMLGELYFSGTAVAGSQLLACIFQAPVQLGANATGIVVASHSNGGPASKAIIKSAVTITGPAAGLWLPVAEQLTATLPAQPGQVAVINRNLNGRILLPPGQGLGLSLLSPTGTTPTYLPIAEWIEVETDTE